MPVRHRLRLLAFPVRTRGGTPPWPDMRSRFPQKERPHMPGSTTALSRTSARNNAPNRVAFRQRYGVGAQNDLDFAAQWLAYADPLPSRCGLLFLHRGGLSPPTPCRSPGALSSRPISTVSRRQSEDHAEPGGFVREIGKTGVRTCAFWLSECACEALRRGPRSMPPRRMLV